MDSSGGRVSPKEAQFSPQLTLLHTPAKAAETELLDHLWLLGQGRLSLSCCHSMKHITAGSELHLQGTGQQAAQGNYTRGQCTKPLWPELLPHPVQGRKTAQQERVPGCDSRNNARLTGKASGQTITLGSKGISVMAQPGAWNKSIIIFLMRLISKPEPQQGSQNRFVSAGNSSDLVDNQYCSKGQDRCLSGSLGSRLRLFSPSHPPPRCLQRKNNTWFLDYSYYCAAEIW